MNMKCARPHVTKHIGHLPPGKDSCSGRRFFLDSASLTALSDPLLGTGLGTAVGTWLAKLHDSEYLHIPFLGYNTVWHT